MGYLFLTTVYEWTTKKPGRRLNIAYVDGYLLNTNRCIEIQSTDRGTKFWYANDPDDRRDSPDHIECSTALGVLIMAHDTDPDEKMYSFPIFPDMDITQAAVDTTIAWDDIAYVYQTYQDIQDGVSHMVYYRKAWERVECIVDLSLTEILSAQTFVPV